MSLIEWLAQRAPAYSTWNFLIVYLHKELGGRAYEARDAKDLARLLCS